MINKAPFNYKYKLSQKALSTLSIYKTFTRLKSQVLSRETCRLLAGRQTCNQILLLEREGLGTLDRLAHHLSNQGDPKSPPPIFFVLTNFGLFGLGDVSV